MRAGALRAFLPAAAACLVAALAGAEPARLRVLEFNVLYGGDPRAELGADNPLNNKPRHAAIAALVRETRADIVILCETTAGSRAQLPALLPDHDAIGDLLIRRSLGARALDAPTPPKHMTGGPGATLRLPNGTDLVVFGTHWRGNPDTIEAARLASVAHQPEEAWTAKLAAHPSTVTAAQATAQAVEPWIRRGAAVVLAGDLNAASHLDWTARARSLRRWAGGPTPEIAWEATKRLAEAGLVDVYRATHPDEVKSPGDTWTPPYPDGMPGRRPIADQYAARIDYIFIAGPCRPVDAWVIGERGSSAEMQRETWFSDHRAVLAEIEVGR